MTRFHATDLAFDKAGTLYVLEIDSNGIIVPPTFGAIYAIDPGGTRRTVVAPDGTLTEPGGIAVGPHGDLFVTNRARSPDDGQVLRIAVDD
jgi:DNA-binding beta-propeller fold protein YncE